MIQIVKVKGKPRERGEEFTCYFGSEKHLVGEVADVVNQDGEMLNIAQVVDSETKDGDIYLTFKVIA